MESTFTLKEWSGTAEDLTTTPDPWLLDRTITLAAKGLLIQLIYLKATRQPITYQTIEGLTGHPRKDINAALTSLMEGGYVRG